MDAERGSVFSWDTDKKQVQLRVTPSELKFLDTAAGKVYRLPITLHNLGRWNQKIRFQEPSKPQFKLVLNNLDKELASGLQMTAVVEYHPYANEDIFDKLLISAGNKTIEVPLIGRIPSCQLEIESEVNFGKLVANGKVYCKEIHVINSGKSPGVFTAEYQGRLPILVYPNTGTVEAKSSMIVKVDFCADKACVVNEVVRVSLQGHPDAFLSIKANVVEQIIELLNANGEKKLDCVRFGSTFFGTSKIEYAVLYNNSPETLNWVAIMQDNSVGEELGTNIQQRTDVALNNLTYISKMEKVDITSFISCIPNEGNLLPYQKTKITFCFSPKLIYDCKKDVDPSHRQDYALFLRFESVGSKDELMEDDDNTLRKNDRFQKVELALTGSGIPVLLQFNPAKVFKFPPCIMGEHSEILCLMQNRSDSLPIMYHFQKTAHFKIDPKKGKLDEGCIQNVVCSFIPHQIGSFKSKQVVEIIGLVADESFQSLSMKPFHHIYLDFHGVCRSQKKKVQMKVNPGISPAVTNPVGEFVVEDFAKGKDYAPVAMLQSAGTTHIHSHQANKKVEEDAQVALPNDRAASIRSGERDERFRTIFTEMARYHYIDPDFAYTKSEELGRKGHRSHYDNYIKYSRNTRLQKQAKRQHKYPCDDADVDLQSTSGFKPPDITGADVEEEIPSTKHQSKKDKLLSTKNMEAKEAESLKKKVLSGFKLEPLTPQEIQDCCLNLTPKQIHQVNIGPSVLNFGDVCLNSTNIRPLHVINTLPTHVLVKLDINSKELQKTEQLSYVIPPTTSTYVSIIFKSSIIGKFWKSFTFTVNNIPGGHILVMAAIQPVKLELSSNELVLTPYNFSAKACFKGIIRIYNRKNYFAQFKWLPANKDKKMAFTISPSTGIVEEFSTLECEVTWQPDVSSPERGEFILQVYEGNTETLKCVANVGHTKVVISESRILFNNCPQGLTTWRRTILHNVGQNRAYFKICHQNLLPIINIVPSQGLIPIGGITILNISCTPTVAETFETKAKVAIHHSDVIDLRIGGTVEIADVEIDPGEFNFSGTYVGTTQIIPFQIINKGVTRARVELDLKKRINFSLDFKDKSVEYADPKFPKKYSMEIEENTSLECGLAFSPEEVATHKFTIHVGVNFMDASENYMASEASVFPLLPKRQPIVPPCYVQATVLKAPLRLSATNFIFDIPLHTLDANKKVTRIQDLLFYNLSNHNIQWTLDLKDIGKLFKSGIFKFSAVSGHVLAKEKDSISISFCPNSLEFSKCKILSFVCWWFNPLATPQKEGWTIYFCSDIDLETRGGVAMSRIRLDSSKPGKYSVNVPMLLNDNPVCYRTLHLFGEVKSPNLLFDPPFVYFAPVPLDVTTEIEINILPQNFFSDTTLNVKLPKSKEIIPLSVKFPKGKIITSALRGINTKLVCHLSFKSSIPVSFTTNVLFGDESNNWFSLPVTAIAENCILTVYPYMAIHLDNQHIVLTHDTEGNPSKTTSGAPLRSTAAKKMTPLTTKVDTSEPAKRKYIIGMEVRDSILLDKSETSKKSGDKPVEKKQNKQFFAPGEGTEAYKFFEKVVNATQTWFSLFGWPEAPHSISIPETLRRDVCKIQYDSSKPSSKKVSRQNEILKYNKTIYDVVIHLSGKMIPGVNLSQSLPVDNTERLTQLHLQHSSLLTFLKAQGAFISHILPEFLFEPEDYKKWIEMTTSTDNMSESSDTEEEKNPVIIDATDFEALSKQAWTDVLLQMYKVLVLSRVLPLHSSNTPPTHIENTSKINPCFVSSNIYSTPERILLSWLNTNYENTRHTIWNNIPKGAFPPEKWILNFDKDLLDGLVFATQIATYCPFLIESHFRNMYTKPKSPEQHLHNCLIVLNALHEIGIDMDIEAIDIYDPNPILMLMLCVHMYERLPTYLPKKVVSFHCTLYDTVLREILVKNPSTKTLVYNAAIIGRDVDDFSLTQTGDVVTISPRSEITITVQFASRFLRPAEASLLLISKPKNTFGGTTLAFSLRGEVVYFKAFDIIKCKSPCYTWTKVTVNVKNHFHTAGDFSVILVESSTFLNLPSQINESGQFIDQMRQSVAANNSIYKSARSFSYSGNALKTSITSTFIKEFFCSTRTLHLEAEESSSLQLYYLPFNIHIRYCVIILSNQKIGELIYIVKGKGLRPLPSKFIPLSYSHPLNYGTTPEEELIWEDPILYVNCELNQTLDMELKLPLTNEAREKALAFAAQQQMSDLEYERRLITGTLESSSIRVAIAVLGLTMVESFMFFNSSMLKKPKSILYVTELSLAEHFHIPKKVCIPQVSETDDTSQTLKDTKNKAALGYVPVPLRFIPFGPGRYPCHILLTSRYDVRAYHIEGIVNDKCAEAKFEFITPAFKPLTQNIPISNRTKNEWRCKVTIKGDWFYGPSILNIKPGETAQYPLTFKPVLACEVTGRLILQNEIDGVKHIFDVKGIGRQPQALEHVIINCQVGETTNKSLMVPNYAQTSITYEITSDLPMIWGNPNITIEPNTAVPHVICITPWRRGVFKGAISFNVKSRQEDDSQEERETEQSIHKLISDIAKKAAEENSSAISFTVKIKEDDDSREEVHKEQFVQKSMSEIYEKPEKRNSNAVSFTVKSEQDDDSQKKKDRRKSILKPAPGISKKNEEENLGSVSFTSKSGQDDDSQKKNDQRRSFVKSTSEISQKIKEESSFNSSAVSHTAEGGQADDSQKKKERKLSFADSISEIFQRTDEENLGAKSYDSQKKKERKQSCLKSVSDMSQKIKRQSSGTGSSIRDDDSQKMKDRRLSIPISFSDVPHIIETRYSGEISLIGKNRLDDDSQKKKDRKQSIPKSVSGISKKIEMQSSDEISLTGKRREDDDSQEKKDKKYSIPKSMSETSQKVERVISGLFSFTGKRGQDDHFQKMKDRKYSTLESILEIPENTEEEQSGLFSFTGKRGQDDHFQKMKDRKYSTLESILEIPENTEEEQSAVFSFTGKRGQDDHFQKMKDRKYSTLESISEIYENTEEEQSGVFSFTGKSGQDDNSQKMKDRKYSTLESISEIYENIEEEKSGVFSFTDKSRQDDNSQKTKDQKYSTLKSISAISQNAEEQKSGLFSYTGKSRPDDYFQKLKDRKYSTLESISEISENIEEENSGTVSFTDKSRQDDDSQRMKDKKQSIPKSLSDISEKIEREISGIISFTGKSRQGDDFQEDRDQKLLVTKSSSEISQIEEDNADKVANNLKVWYYLEIHCDPAPPVKIIEITCAALETVCIEIPLLNPDDTIIHLDVSLTNSALTGLTRLALNPQQTINYVVKYSPANTGFREESIIFQPDVGLEFWYALRLTTESPKATTMPEVKCEVGKCVTQMISLTNPTHEILALEITNSNPVNFVLDINRTTPLVIGARTTIKLAVHFQPTVLGRAAHQSTISFRCTQFKEWKFFFSGVGLLPEPVETKRVATYLKYPEPIVIRYSNPTMDDVLINLRLTNKEPDIDLYLERSWDSFFDENSAFQFGTLKKLQAISLPPKGSIDIPVLFTPESMKVYKTMVIVEAKKTNGENWLMDNFDELDTIIKSIRSISSRELKAMHWMYPILGVPLAPPPNGPPVVIKCQAKKRIEEKVEIILTGEFFGENPTYEMTEFLVVPKRTPENNYYDDIYEGIREFEYEIEFESEEMKSNLQTCVAVYLDKTSYEIEEEMIGMVFNLVFAPRKPLRSQITLKIECLRDGIWMFPITLIATDPDVDDVIDIEGVGLFKESVVHIRLTSQTRNTEAFKAYFLPGSDPEFTVKPEVGELPPSNTIGARITVGFTPKMYSKKYKATLVVKSATMQWLYEVNGFPERNTLPQNIQPKIDASNSAFKRRVVRRRNFIRENAKLKSTGVSSTIKGAPLISRKK